MPPESPPGAEHDRPRRRTGCKEGARRCGGVELRVKGGREGSGGQDRRGQDEGGEENGGRGEGEEDI